MNLKSQTKSFGFALLRYSVRHHLVLRRPNQEEAKQATMLSSNTEQPIAKRMMTVVLDETSSFPLSIFVSTVPPAAEDTRMSGSGPR